GVEAPQAGDVQRYALGNSLDRAAGAARAGLFGDRGGRRRPVASKLALLDHRAGAPARRPDAADDRARLDSTREQFLGRDAELCGARGGCVPAVRRCARGTLGISHSVLDRTLGVIDDDVLYGRLL